MQPTPPFSPFPHPSLVGVDIPSCVILVGWISGGQARMESDGVRLSQRTSYCPNSMFGTSYCPNRYNEPGEKGLSMFFTFAVEISGLWVT